MWLNWLTFNCNLIINAYVGRKEKMGERGRRKGGRERDGSKGEEEEPRARSPVAQPDVYRGRTSCPGDLPFHASGVRLERFRLGHLDHGGPARWRRGGGVLPGGPQEVRLLVLLRLPPPNRRRAAGLRGLGLHGRPPVLAAEARDAF